MAGIGGIRYNALQAYAALTTSADKASARNLDQFKELFDLLLLLKIHK